MLFICLSVYQVIRYIYIFSVYLYLNCLLTQNGNFDGLGVCRWPDGRIYEGEWKNDRIQGRGKFAYADSSVYEGEWRHGDRHGLGVFTTPEGVYEGEYVNDYKEGSGTFRWKTGFLYEGDFKAGNREGRGVFTHPAILGGAVENGVWRQDKFLQACSCHLQPKKCKCFESIE